MRANSVITSVVGVAAVVGLGIWFALEHQARLKLGDEHKALEQQLKQMAGLVAANEQLSNRVARASLPPPLPADQLRELLRLRGEAGVLREQSQELETVRNENRQAHAALESSLKAQAPAVAGAAATADYWPRGSWAFTGYASPDATLQTLLWAMNNGDLKAVLASATGDVAEGMEKDFAGKSEDEASIRAMDEVSSLQSVRVLNREVQGDDTVVLTAASEGQTDTHTEELLLQKIGNDWKVSGPPQ